MSDQFEFLAGSMYTVEPISADVTSYPCNIKIQIGENMTFAEAFELIREDDEAAIYRDGWNGRKSGHTMFVKTQLVDAGSANTGPYPVLFVETPGDGRGYTRIPWLPSTADLYATDWKKVE